MGADILHCIYTVEMFEISQMNSFWIYTAGSFGQNVVQESGKKKRRKMKKKIFVLPFHRLLDVNWV